jgi:hypothetical protein
LLIITISCTLTVCNIVTLKISDENASFIAGMIRDFAELWDIVGENARSEETEETADEGFHDKVAKCVVSAVAKAYSPYSGDATFKEAFEKCGEIQHAKANGLIQLQSDEFFLGFYLPTDPNDIEDVTKQLCMYALPIPSWTVGTYDQEQLVAAKAVEMALKGNTASDPPQDS